MTIMGTTICWGVKPEWARLPVVNLPTDAVKVRLRFRMKDAGQAFVKLADGTVQRWRLGLVPGGLELAHILGANKGGKP